MTKGKGTYSKVSASKSSRRKPSTTQTVKKKRPTDVVLNITGKSPSQLQVIQRLKGGEELRFMVEYRVTDSLDKTLEMVKNRDFDRYTMGFLCEKDLPDMKFAYWMMQPRTVKKMVESGMLDLKKVNSNFWKGTLKPKYRKESTYDLNDMVNKK